MKIYELNKTERFKMVIVDETLYGTFYGMDGMFAKVIFDGYSQLEYLHCSTEVELDVPSIF